VFVPTENPSFAFLRAPLEKEFLYYKWMLKVKQEQKQRELPDTEEDDGGDAGGGEEAGSSDWKKKLLEERRERRQQKDAEKAAEEQKPTTPPVAGAKRKESGDLPSSKRGKYASTATEYHFKNETVTVEDIPDSGK